MKENKEACHKSLIQIPFTSDVARFYEFMEQNDSKYGLHFQVSIFQNIPAL